MAERLEYDLFPDGFAMTWRGEQWACRARAVPCGQHLLKVTATNWAGVTYANDLESVYLDGGLVYAVCPGSAAVSGTLEVTP